VVSDNCTLQLLPDPSSLSAGAPWTPLVPQWDVQDYFRGEDEEPDVTTHKPSLPENLTPWDVTEKMTDYQLKVALNYLNVAAAPAVGKNTARAP
jgi:hypothetical protein